MGVLKATHQNSQTMKLSSTYSLIFALLFLPCLSLGQIILNNCNEFEVNPTFIYLDSASSWEIGAPNKTVFNSSYNSVQSIVTKLDTTYPNNDTSIFYASYTDYVPLISVFELEFYHRFLTDTLNDYGLVEYTIDGGANWYDALSDSFKSNQGVNGLLGNMHYFQTSGDTLFDSLDVTGNSNGWVYSRISKEINQGNIDSIQVRFTFISDSVGGNEGWQIDDLCVGVSFYGSIEEGKGYSLLSIYPNPTEGAFSVENPQGQAGSLKLYNLIGQEVFSASISSRATQSFTPELPPGIYSAVLDQAGTKQTAKVVVR